MLATGFWDMQLRRFCLSIILHQTIIVLIGFFVVQWNLDIALKYLIISTTSFAAIMAIYELLVRRINIVRFLFDLRLKKKPAD